MKSSASVLAGIKRNMAVPASDLEIARAPSIDCLGIERWVYV